MALKALTSLANPLLRRKKCDSDEDPKAITIIYAKWIAQCKDDSDDPLLIENGAIAIKDDKILSVGSISEVEEEAYKNPGPYRKVELSEHHLIIPGLINMHTHLAMSLLRGYSNDVDLDSFLKKHVWPAEDAIMGENFVYHGTLLACAEAILSGTTTMNDSYFLPEVSRKAVELAGLRVVNSNVLLDAGKNDMEEQIVKAEKFIDDHYNDLQKLKKHFQVSLNPHSCYTVPEEWLKRLETIQKRINTEHPEDPLLCHIHLHETKLEREKFESQNNKTALQALESAGLCNQYLIAAHCVHMNKEEIATLAEYKVNVSHCIKSNMKLGSGIAPVVDMLKAGVNVCIGTDGACSNNSVDMLSEMRHVCLVHKGVCGEPTIMSAYTVLKMATRNGAKALGRLHELGSIEPNKLADIVAIDLSGYQKANYPIFNPIAQLLYVSNPLVTDVWVNGQQLMSKRNILRFELELKSMDPIITKLKELKEKNAANKT